MKLPKKKNKNTVLVVSLVVAALIIVSALAFYFWMVKSADSEIENNEIIYCAVGVGSMTIRGAL